MSLSVAECPQNHTSEHARKSPKAHTGTSRLCTEEVWAVWGGKGPKPTLEPFGPKAYSKQGPLATG